MEVAPVDAEVVARPVEWALFLRTDVEDVESVGVRAAPGDGLVGRVDCNARIDVEEESDLVGGTVGGRDGPREVGDGARE